MPWVQHAYVATTRATQSSGANARHQLPSAWAHADTARANAKSPTPVEWPTTACRAHQLQWYASAHTRTMGNPMMQRIYSGTSTTTTTTTTQHHSSRPYIEGYFGGGGKVSSLERGGRGKVAQQKEPTHTRIPSADSVANGAHTTQPIQRIPACGCVCAAVQPGQGGSSDLLRHQHCQRK